MNRPLPINPQALASGQAATLAFTVFDNLNTVLVARNFGNCVDEGGGSYVFPGLVQVDATKCGTVRYDIGGTSGAVGPTIWRESFDSIVPFAAIGDGGAALTALAQAGAAPTWWNAPDNADVGTILAGINTALTNLGTVLTGGASLSANVAAIKAVTDALNTLLEADPNNAGDSRIVAAAFANLLTQLGFGFPVVANPGPSTTAISFQVATGTIPAGHYVGRKAYRPLSAGEAAIVGHVIASVNLGGLGYDVHTISFATSAPFPAVPAVGDAILISA